MQKPAWLAMQSLEWWEWKCCCLDATIWFHQVDSGLRLRKSSLGINGCMEKINVKNREAGKRKKKVCKFVSLLYAHTHECAAQLRSLSCIGVQSKPLPPLTEVGGGVFNVPSYSCPSWPLHKTILCCNPVLPSLLLYLDAVDECIF